MRREELRTVYGELVRSGFDYGASGFPFPEDEPIGSAWAHGFRLGANYRTNIIGRIEHALTQQKHDQDNQEHEPEAAATVAETAWEIAAIPAAEGAHHDQQQQNDQDQLQGKIPT